ncbi:MAG: MoaD/ThiS family protein [Vulcanimicrobiaceae bacterium]
MAAIDRSRAEHYVWGGGCDGWHLVKTPTLSVIAERMPPGAAERLHHHERAHQFFYVLEGAATFEIAGVQTIVQPGAGIEIAPGAVHRVSNHTTAPIEFVAVSQPPTHGDRVDDEAAADAAAVRVTVLAFARLREILGYSERAIAVPEGATVGDLWQVLVAGAPELGELGGSTRAARNGEVVMPATVLAAGDEIALLPPVGGG